MARKKLSLIVTLSLFWILQLDGQIMSEIKLDQNWLERKKAFFSNENLIDGQINPTNEILSVKPKNSLLSFHKTDLIQENSERQEVKKYYILEKEVNLEKMSPMPTAIIPDGVKYHLLIKKMN